MTAAGGLPKREGMAPSHRRLATALLVLSCLFLLSGIAVGKMPAVAEWLTPIAEALGITDKGVFWVPMGLGFAFLLPFFLLWRCPYCRSFPGPITAAYCRGCGRSLRLGDDPGGTLVAELRAKADRRSADRPLDPAQALRFQRIVRRLQSIERFGSKSHWAAMGLAVLTAGGVFLYRRDLTAAAMAGLVVGLVVFFFTHYGYAMTKNVALLWLRCPGCRKSLVSNLVEFCPHCGVRLPAP